MWQMVREELKYALRGGGIVGSLSTIPLFIVLSIGAGLRNSRAGTRRT